MIKISDYIALQLKKYTDHAFIGQGSSILHLLYSIKKIGIKKEIPKTQVILIIVFFLFL